MSHEDRERVCREEGCASEDRKQAEESTKNREGQGLQAVLLYAAHAWSFWRSRQVMGSR